MQAIVTFHRLLRYGYGGFFLLGLVLWNEARANAGGVASRASEPIKVAVEAAGPVLGPMVIFAVGAAIYVMYRFLLGEYLLYPLSHFVDWATSARNRSNAAAISPVWHLRQQGVPRRALRDAYNAVRRQCMGPGMIERLNLAHAEAHVLYLTAIVLISFGYCARISLFEIVGGVVLVVALFNDVRQHREEMPEFLESLVANPDFLKKQGFITV
jgi:hypothetical protein